MERDRMSSRDYERDRDRDRTRNSSSRESERDHGRDREASTSPKSRERERERHRERDRDRERERDRALRDRSDYDRPRERERDRERDRSDYERPRERDRDRDRDYRDRDRDHRDRGDGRDRSANSGSSSSSSSVAFSRPATYDPRLLQRTQMRHQRGYDDDDGSIHYEDAIRRKQLKDELGLSDDDQDALDGGHGSDDDSAARRANTQRTTRGSGAGTNDAAHREVLAQLEQLQKELQAAREGEQKAQESLSKLQLLSKSQTAILKTTMAKKVQEKEDLLDEMASAIKDLEAKLETAGVAFETYIAPEQAKASTVSSSLGAGAGVSAAEAIGEISTMKTEIDRLAEENKALRLAATQATAAAVTAASTASASASRSPTAAAPPSPTKDAATKAKLDALEADKRALAQQLKEAQQKLAQLKAAAPVLPPPTAVPPTTVPPAPPVDIAEALRKKLADAESALQSSQKTIQRLEKELAASQQAMLSSSSSSDAANASVAAAAAAAKEAAKIEADLQAQVSTLQHDLETAQAALTQQTTKAQATDAASEQKYAKLKATAEAELTKIKEQAKRAILDLKKRLETNTGDQQRKRTSLQALQTHVQTHKREVAVLKAQIAAQQTQLPLLVQQLVTDKITQRVQKQNDAMAGVVDNYKREMKERKRLFNLVQELKGNIRVLCRVRPISKSEVASGSKMICKFTNEEITLAGEKGKLKTWEFDRVFDMQSTQDQVFAEVRPLVTSILDGYSVCIFAYGQTGSGKTHTMAGPTESPGINTRSLQELFERKRQRSSEYVDEINVSVLEIYNEQIRDLLAVDVASTNLQVRQGPTGNFVPGLTVVPVETLDEVFELIKRGNKNRSTHATDMNEHSSRSHSILSIQIKSVNIVTTMISNGKLFLVDLAGSERLSKTGAEGLRLKEAQNINKSLSALGDVIAARASKAKHVPYRNSSLTYLLQDALGGDSKTLMVACASPVDYNSDESFCTLNFAARTRSVEMGKATKNVTQAKE